MSKLEQISHTRKCLYAAIRADQSAASRLLTDPSRDSGAQFPISLVIREVQDDLPAVYRSREIQLIVAFII
jgi:hypothetical protein